MNWNNELNTLLLSVIAGGIAWIVTSIIMEISAMSEQDRHKWEIVRAGGKTRHLLPYLLQGVFIGIALSALRYFRGKKVTWDGIADLLIIYQFVFFSVGLAVWRTNELKYLGKIPSKWRGTNTKP